MLVEELLVMIDRILTKDEIVSNEMLVEELLVMINR